MTMIVYFNFRNIKKVNSQRDTTKRGVRESKSISKSKKEGKGNSDHCCENKCCFNLNLKELVDKLLNSSGIELYNITALYVKPRW